MKKLAILLTLSLVFVGCSTDTVKIGDHKKQIDANTARLVLIEIEQTIQNARLDALELSTSDLGDAVEHLTDYLDELEGFAEEFLSHLSEYLDDIESDIEDLEEAVKSVEDDISDIREALENSNNCSIELRDERETRRGLRADIFIVCDEGELRLRNNAILSDDDEESSDD